MVTRDIVQRLLNVINDTRRRVNTLESREYVLLNATQTLTNKTLTTPTIGDFSNAQHSHADAAGGGQLSLTTAVSGVLPAANGGTGVNNATRTLTINTNSGTLAFSGAGYTLTIPATGTAALLGTANVFTAAQRIDGQLGIGTTPSYSLHIVGSAPRVYVEDPSTTGRAVLQTISDSSFFISNAWGSAAAGSTAGLSNAGLVSFNAGSNTAFLLMNASGSPLVLGTSSAERMRISSIGDVGINTTSPSAKLHVDQSSASGAKPTLRLQQLDLSEEFIRFDTTVGAGNPINTTALGAYYGRVRVWVEGVGAKWLALYD